MVAGLRARSAVVSGRVAALFLVSVLACSSGSSGPGSSLPLASVEVGAARLDVHTPSGRPRVVLVARDGDPASALAAAIEVDGAPSVLSALGEALRRRFEDSPGARVEVASGSLFVALDFDDPEKGLAKLRTLLMTPLSSEEERVAIAA
ncbi:MAG: hypothetical protein HOV80_24155, partial [Polyangiaceae bacterium]|nr:hypothetical protein [Polyangiaceae bacterium]